MPASIGRLRRRDSSRVDAERHGRSGAGTDEIQITHIAKDLLRR